MVKAVTSTSSSIPAAELGHALQHGEIRPIYMVLADLATNETAAVEALARWYRPSSDVVAPDDFVPAAEATGLIVDLDLAIAQQAMTDLAGWQTTRPELHLTINLSGLHLTDPDSVNHLTKLAAQAGVDPATVVLELTETVRPQDLHRAAGIAEQLRTCGFHLWLDDFGTGWSNLSDLIHLPIDGIKLDRPFARQLGVPLTDTVIRAITQLAADLGLTVTIEGIEHRPQADQAHRLGCHLGQGFLWPHGLTADDVANHLIT